MMFSAFLSSTHLCNNKAAREIDSNDFTNAIKSLHTALLDLNGLCKHRSSSGTLKAMLSGLNSITASNNSLLSFKMEYDEGMRTFSQPLFLPFASAKNKGITLETVFYNLGKKQDWKKTKIRRRFRQFLTKILCVFNRYRSYASSR